MISGKSILITYVDKKGKYVVMTYGRRYKICFCLLGITMAIGEQVNQYFQYASTLFTLIGAILMLTVLLRILYTHKIKIYGKDDKLFLLLGIVVFGITTFHLIRGNVDNTSLMEFYKIPLFIILGYCFESCIQADDSLIDVFLIGFIIGSVCMIPLGQIGIYDNTMRFMGTYMNPNTYAVDCFVVIFS